MERLRPWVSGREEAPWEAAVAPVDEGSCSWLAWLFNRFWAKDPLLGAFCEGGREREGRMRGGGGMRREDEGGREGRIRGGMRREDEGGGGEKGG